VKLTKKKTQNALSAAWESSHGLELNVIAAKEIFAEDTDLTLTSPVQSHKWLLIGAVIYARKDYAIDQEKILENTSV
jgi:hypothetical protein